MREPLNESIQQSAPVTENKGEDYKAAMLSALVIPGAGQFYNRQWGKGLFVMIAFLLSSLGVIVPITIGIILYLQKTMQADVEGARSAIEPILHLWIHLIVLTIISVILYVYSIVDSYKYRKQSGKIGES
jgi:TM2 domain-containing membrane protein YozV